MSGRYLGQVTAQINARGFGHAARTQLKTSFACLVQVEQDKERTLSEVTLKECNEPTT